MFARSGCTPLPQVRSVSPPSSAQTLLGCPRSHSAAKLPLCVGHHNVGHRLRQRLATRRAHIRRDHTKRRRGMRLCLCMRAKGGELRNVTSGYGSELYSTRNVLLLSGWSPVMSFLRSLIESPRTSASSSTFGVRGSPMTMTGPDRWWIVRSRRGYRAACAHRCLC